MTATWSMGQRARRVHLVGIGGSGMSGIAEVLLNLGHEVTGSDLRSSPVIRSLEERGAKVWQGHDRDQVQGAHVVVVSTAIPPDNPEVQQARARRIPVIQRAEMLAELMRLKHGLIVAGSHGKTSTSAMVATILAEVGLDPTAIIGGRPNGWSSSSRVGTSDLLVAEADESDGSFLHLSPTFAVITNIGSEHLDHYGGNVDGLREAFVQLVERVPFWGGLALCGDDPGIQTILPRVNRPFVTYGADPRWDYVLGKVEVRPEGTGFGLTHGGRRLEAQVAALGWHHALNALGALAIVSELGVDLAAGIEALAGFRGVDRRFSVRGEVRRVVVADDYGHHPTEIRATLEAARQAYPDRRIRVGFQPHRYSRTLALMKDFATSFDQADEVWIAPVYAAGEAAVLGAESADIARELELHGHVAVQAVAGLDAMVEELGASVGEKDLVVFLGAGDVHRCGSLLLERLKCR